MEKNNNRKIKIKLFALQVISLIFELKGIDDDTKYFLLTRLLDTCIGLNEGKNKKNQHIDNPKFWVYLQLSMYKVMTEDPSFLKLHPRDHHNENIHTCGRAECKNDFHDKMITIVNEDKNNFMKYKNKSKGIVLEFIKEITDGKKFKQKSLKPIQKSWLNCKILTEIYKF